MTLNGWYNSKCLDGMSQGGLLFVPPVNTRDIGQTALYETTIVLLRLGNGGNSHGGRFAMLTETEKAYLAGIVDADGCISISHSKGRNANNPNHTLAVVISQADKLFLERWQEKVGLGGVYLSKRAHKKEGHLFARNRDQYLWMMSASQAESLLSMLLPYLDIKRPQAEIALRFRQTKKEHIYSRGARLSDDILRRRDQCEREMKALNKKRKVPKSTPDNDRADRPQQLQLEI